MPSGALCVAYLGVAQEFTYKLRSDVSKNPKDRKAQEALLIDVLNDINEMYDWVRQGKMNIPSINIQNIDVNDECPFSVRIASISRLLAVSTCRLQMLMSRVVFARSAVVMC